MSKNNQNFTAKINLTGDADFSGIINNLNKMYSVIQNKADQADIINIDKSITKIKELQSQIQKSQSQGFLNQSEISTYNKNVSSLLKIADQLGVKFSNIKLTGLEDGIAEAKRAMREYQEQLNSLIKQTKGIVEGNLPNSSSYKKALLETIGKDEAGRKKYEALITKEFRDQIEEAEKLRDIAKETLDIKTQDYNIAKANLAQQDARNQAMKDTKGGRTNYTGTLSDLGLKSSDIRDKGRFISKNRQTEISGILQDVINKSANAEAAIENFQKKLSETETISNNVKEAIRNLYAEFDRNKAEAQEALAIARTQEKDQGKLRSDALSKYNKAGDAVNVANKNYDVANAYLNSAEYQNNLNAIAAASANYANAQQEVNNLQAQEISIINQLASGTSVLNSDINKATSAQSSYASELSKAAVAQQSYDSQLSRLSYHIKYILSIANAWRQVRSIVIQTYNDVSKLDKAFAEIAMVTNYSVSDMWGQYSNYAEMANRLGQTTESVIQASGLYYQQGLDTAEALKLTEDTMKLATLAGLDFKDATSQMTAALRAFHMEMDEGSHVTDVYAEVAANAAVDVQGLSDAMSATAAIANSSGMSFENTTAMLATMVEATQEAPKNLGTAMKSVLARFTELKKGVSDTEEDFESIDYNKVDKALKSVGISIKDANGQFRNMDEVLLELGSKWNSLSRNSQRYIATIAAGSRQQSRFIALMENYDRTRQLIDVATNSAGRANEQFAKYTDTVEYKVTKIKNSWEELRVTLMNKNFFSGILDGLDGVLNKMKTMDIKDFAFISTWVLTVGRTLVTGLIQAISTGGNKIRQAIATTITKQKYSIELQAKMDGAFFQRFAENSKLKQIDAQKKTVETAANYSKDQWLNKGNNTWTDPAQQAAIENINNLLLKRVELQKALTSELNKEKQDSAQIENLKKEILINEEQVKSTIDSETNSLSQEGNVIRATALERLKTLDREQEITREYEKQKRIIEQTKNLNKAKWIQSAGTALGQAATTAVSMAMTGSFSAAEIAASTMTTSIMGAVGALASGNVQLFIAQAAIAGLSAGVKYIVGKIEEGRERTKRENDEVYRIRKQLEELEKVQEEYNKKLDKANSKYNEAADKWDKISEASKKYQELSEKSLLSSDEEQELLETKQNLVDLVPELVSGYNNEAQAVIVTGEKYDALIKKYEDAQIEAKALQKQAEATAEALGLVHQYVEVEEDLAMAKEMKKVAEVYKTKTWEIRLGDRFNSEYLDFNLNDILSQEKYGQPIVQWLEQVWKDNSATGEAQRKLIIDALNETEGTPSKLSNTASIKEVKAAIADSTDADRVVQDFLNNYKTEFEDITSKVEELDSEAQAKKAELQRKIPEIRSSIIDGIMASIDTTGVDERALAHYKEYLNKQLSDEELGNFIEQAADPNITNGSFIDKGIDKYYKAYAEGNDNLELLKRLNDQQLELYSEYTEEILGEGGGKSRRQAYNRLLKAIGVTESSDLGQLLYDKIANTEQNLADAALKASQLLQSNNLEGNYNNIYNNFNKIGETTTNAIVKAIADKSDDPETRAQLTKGVIDLLNKGIDAHAISTAVNAIDWSGITLFDEQTVLESLEGALEDFDLNDSEIKTIYEILSEFFTGQELSEDVVLSSADALVEKYEKIADKSSKLADYFGQNLDKIAISGKDATEIEKALTEAGAPVTPFMSKSEYGSTIFDVKAAEDWFDTQTNISNTYKKQLDLLKQKEQTEGALSEEEQNTKNQLIEQIDKLELQENVVKTILGLYKDINSTLDTQIKKISSSISSYSSLMSNFYSKGYFDASSISSFANSIFDIDPNANIKSFFNGNSFNSEYYQTWIKNQIDALKANKQLNDAQKEQLFNLQMLDLEMDEANINLKEQATKESELVKAEKEVAEAHKAVEKALEDIAKAEQDVIDKQSELNKVMYGSDNFKNQLDTMYNYSTLNQKYADAMQRAKDILDNPNVGEDTKAALQEYMSGSRSQILNYLAQNKVYDAAARADLGSLYDGLPQKLQELNNKFGANYDTNIKQYFKIIDGILTTDIQALNNAALPDDIKNEIASLAQSYNSNTNNILKNNDAIKKLLKERQEIHKANLQAEVAIQEKVADVLKEKYQEQVDDLKDKYDAMKDADNDYLDALQDSIDKQRKLRDQENKYDELAQKRKKLSLQLRDTSGANTLNNQKLQDEIKKDEQSLLDETIDNVLNNLKELYELQEETRQDEIEYQEALIENTNWIAEANKIVLGLGTAQDFINWMKDNSEDWKNKTAEQIELEEMELTEMFQKHQKYMEEQEQQILESLNITEQEIQEVINNTSESLINESERSLNEITTKVDEAITSAEESLKTAMENLAEKQKAYTEALQTESEKVSDLGMMYQAASNAAQQMLDLVNQLDSSSGGASKGGISSYEIGSFNSTENSDAYQGGGSKISGDTTAKENAARGAAQVLNNAVEAILQSPSDIDGYNVEKYLKWTGGYYYLTDLMQQYHLSASHLAQGFKERGYHGYYGTNALYIGNYNIDDTTANNRGLYKFKEGGLVNYTGPAWVDGTPTRPEAFLSADDTENIAAMTNILSSLKDLFDFSTYSQSPTINNTNKNDTTINVTVNVDGISSDYDIDQAVERVKEDIVNAASYAGANVILNI